MTKSEYESIVWYYRPATARINQWNGDQTEPARDAMQTGNQPAKLVTVPDKTIVSNIQTDTLVFYIDHNNISQRVEIPVYTVTRNCTKSQN